MNKNIYESLNNQFADEELGGTMPEDLPTPEENLKKLERRVKSAENKMIKNSELPNKLENVE